MLRKFAVENFFSIRECQELDFRVASNASDPDSRFAHSIESSEDRFPRVIVLFGANASGKTNFLKAIDFLARFVRDSVDWPPDDLIPFLTFFSDGWSDAPASFLAEFDAEFEALSSGRQKFIYELEIDGDGKSVSRESLKWYKTSRPRTLFNRSFQAFKFGPDFDISKDDPINQRIRPNASVVSTLAKFNHPIATTIFNALGAVKSDVLVTGKYEINTEKNATKYYYQNSDVLAGLKSDLARMDFGLSDIFVEKHANGLEPNFLHKGLDYPLSFSFESQGTQNYYKLYPFIHYVLQTGGVALFDELGSDIHPLLLPEILRVFQDPKSNPNDAQLIMTCHNATLLESLCKEEVFFAEKGQNGVTELYGLGNVSGVRRDTNIYAKYLNGVFGAVPQVG